MQSLESQHGDISWGRQLIWYEIPTCVPSFLSDMSWSCQSNPWFWVILLMRSYELSPNRSFLSTFFCCSQATHPFFGLTTKWFLPNVYWQPRISKPWLVHWEPHAKSDDLLLNRIRLYPSYQLININIHLGLNLSFQSKIWFSLSKPDETYNT